MSAPATASGRLLAETGEIAREVTEALYREMPELLERHGERGRAKCLQDIRYNVEHLAPAVELDDPEMFARYVRWVDALLRARNVSTRELARSLALLDEAIRRRVSPAEAEAAGRCIAAGAAALRGEPAP